MSSTNYVAIYFVSLAVFLGIDSIWLSQATPRVYKKYIGHLLADKPRLIVALIFYLLFVFGLDVFVIVPAVNKLSILNALAYGSLFGLITYATFDLTNMAVLKKWPLAITLIDMAWGLLLSGATSVFSYLIITRFIA